MLSAAGDFNFSVCLERVWEVINLANKLVEDVKPWNLAKENKTLELGEFIAVMVEVIRASQEAIAPFMPQTASAIQEQFKDTHVVKGQPLFPRILNP